MYKHKYRVAWHGTLHLKLYIFLKKKIEIISFGPWIRTENFRIRDTNPDPYNNSSGSASLKKCCFHLMVYGDANMKLVLKAF